MKTYLNQPSTDIPLGSQIVKDKILFHTQDKILVFRQEGKQEKVFVPDFSFRENDSAWSEFLRKYEFLLEEEILYQAIEYRLIHENQKDVCHECVSNYYSYYTEFPEELIQEISSLAYKRKLDPYLLTFQEIKNLKRTKDFYFDLVFKKASRVLDKEVKKYVRKKKEGIRC